MMSDPVMYSKETEDLETHVSLCHQRYLQLDQRMVKIESDVSEIKADILDGHKSLKSTIITTTGTILVALIALMAAILTESA